MSAEQHADELLAMLIEVLDVLGGGDSEIEQAARALVAKATGEPIPGLEVSDSNFGAWVDAGGTAP